MKTAPVTTNEEAAVKSLIDRLSVLLAWAIEPVTAQTAARATTVDALRMIFPL
jgi:hypothetical protein